MDPAARVFEQRPVAACVCAGGWRRAHGDGRAPWDFGGVDWGRSGVPAEGVGAPNAVEHLFFRGNCHNDHFPAALDGGARVFYSFACYSCGLRPGVWGRDWARVGSRFAAPARARAGPGRLAATALAGYMLLAEAVVLQFLESTTSVVLVSFVLSLVSVVVIFSSRRQSRGPACADDESRGRHCSPDLHFLL